MTSTATESVEIVEVTWKIPNFRHFIPTRIKQNVVEFRQVVLIGGRLPPACPQSKSPPVKLEVSVFKVEGLFKFMAVLHKSQPSSPCTISGGFLEFKTCNGRRADYKFAEGINGSGDREAMDLSDPQINITLFDNFNAGGYTDERDGSLNIYFKMEITCSCLEPNGGMEFTEMSGGFESLLKNPTQSDVEIKVTRGEGQTFKCHKAILAGRSEVFRAMFEIEMKESKDGVVEVEDILPKTMEHFLSFVYCGRFQDSSWIRSLPELVYVSDKYGVKSLKNICDLHLILSVTPQNAMALGILAERHGLTKAAKDIRGFIAENVYAVTLDPDSDTSSSDANLNVCYSVPTPE